MSRPNELELDDLWQRGVFDRLLRPVLYEHSYRNQILFLDCKSSVAVLLQKRAHVDIVAQLPHGGSMSVEVKIVRWPGAKENRPAYYHWRDLFLETMSSSIPGREQKGWMHSSQADILLWCQCALHENWLDCFPFDFAKLRIWFVRNIASLPERRVANVINGTALWTVGRLAPISKICRDLKVQGFRVTDEGLINDLYGKPLLRFMHNPNAA